MVGSTFPVWIVISKMIVVHKNGDKEEEENSNDYLALHVYPND